HGRLVANRRHFGKGSAAADERASVRVREVQEADAAAPSRNGRRHQAHLRQVRRTCALAREGIVAMASRLREKYEKDVRGKLRERFGYKNPHQVPKLDKVVINMSVG